MSTITKFRTCPTTGLKVDLNAERLIKANAVVAVVFLAIGGFFGLLVITQMHGVGLGIVAADFEPR